MPTLDDEQDLTRKQRREQAREERKEAERAAAASDTRRTRLMQLGGVLGVVVVIVVVILVATGGGSKGPGKVKENSPQETKLVSEVNSLVGGIPESGNVLGSPSAPVTLVYFGDLQCPFCGEFSRGPLSPLIERFVRPGKLRIEYRNLETATHEPETFRTQQTAAMAAGKQNLAWYYIELFYRQQSQENSGYVTEEFLRALARQVPGLNMTAWLAARSNPEYATQITTDAQAANNAGFTGTPSFQIGRTGGALKKLEYESLTNPAPFEKAIESLAKA
jgi:protein-disulfide isomerase